MLDLLPVAPPAPPESPPPCQGCLERDSMLERYTVALEAVASLLPEVVGGLRQVTEGLELYRRRMERIDGCLGGLEEWAQRVTDAYPDQLPPYPEYRRERGARR